MVRNWDSGKPSQELAATLPSHELYADPARYKHFIRSSYINEENLFHAAHSNEEKAIEIGRARRDRTHETSGNPPQRQFARWAVAHIKENGEDVSKEDLLAAFRALPAEQ